MADTIYIYGLCDPRTQELRYVGVTNDLERRISQHLRDRSISRKANWIRSLLKENYKPEMFVIEEVEESNWQEREQHWIGFYRGAGSDLTNLTIGGDAPMLGKKHTPETRAKMSQVRRGENNHNYGKKFSAETCEKIGEAHRGEKHPNYGKHLSEETRVKIGEANSGRRRTPETRRKMSEAKIGKHPWNYGKHLSDALRAKLSEAHTGIKHHLFGKHLSPETRAKIRMSKLGKPRTLETRIKLSISGKKWWDRKKSAEAHE